LNALNPNPPAEHIHAHGDSDPELNSQPKLGAALIVDEVSFRYPEGRAALNRISFQVAPGETIGLIGPNGAGKSTLLLLLTGLLGLSSRTGSISVGGITLGEKTAPEMRRRIGLLFQDPDDQLFSPTVGEDVAFGPEQSGLPPTAVDRRVKEALNAVGLSGTEARLSHRLSLGEKKRVCLAGVLACRPELLLFDEPTANLDPRGRREFVELCRKLSATKLVASHDLEMILALCQRVLLLDRGALVASGDARVVLGNEPLMLEHGLEKPHSLFHHHPHGEIPPPD